jgi:hypothetical protein
MLGTDMNEKNLNVIKNTCAKIMIMDWKRRAN